MVKGADWVCWARACFVCDFDTGEFVVWELEGE
jgi:hypothetical protein